jgi:alpha-L-fucosidase 2
MEFELDAADRDATAESLLRRVQNGELPPALVEKMWMYARYLMICATRPDGRPMTPYGLWCGDYKAVGPALAADSDIHAVYAHTLSGNLADLLLPVFGYYEHALDDLKKNAQRLFNVRGIFLPTVNSPGTGMPGSCDPEVTFFTAGAAVVSNLFYDYALFTDDSKFLKSRAMPFMKDAALFYEDFLKLGHNGKYTASPSYSPGTTPGNFAKDGEERLAVAADSTVDFAAARELFQNLIKAANETGIYKSEVQKWEDMLTKIPEYEINSDRALKEYIGSRYTDNYASEKAPHLYAAYPGTEINTQTADNELVKAFLNAAKKRVTLGLREQTSSSLGALGSVFARLGDGDSAADCLETIVRSSVMNNLVTARNDWRNMGISSSMPWAPYHIQGNTAFAGVVQDMLIGSTSDSIKVFPAVVSEWEKISVAGLLTRAGVEAEISYTAKNGTLLLTLKAKKNTKVNLYFPAGTKKLAKGPGIENFNAEELCLKGVTVGSKPVTFDIKYSSQSKR